MSFADFSDQSPLCDGAPSTAAAFGAKLEQLVSGLDETRLSLLRAVHFLKSNPYSSRTQDSLPILRAQASSITSEIYDLLKAAPREHIRSASAQLHLFEEISTALRRDVALSLKAERSLHSHDKKNLRAGSSSTSSRESTRHSSKSARAAKSNQNDVSLDEEEVAKQLHKQSEADQLLQAQQKATRKYDADSKLDEYLQIEQDLDQLAELYADVQALVQDQGVQLDTVEDNVASARVSVEAGVKDVAIAAKHKSKHSLLKATGVGALVGAAIAGPVGLGLALGGAAVMGITAGATVVGGAALNRMTAAINKSNRKQNDMLVQEMEDRKAQRARAHQTQQQQRASAGGVSASSSTWSGPGQLDRDRERRFPSGANENSWPSREGSRPPSKASEGTWPSREETPHTSAYS